MPAEHRQLDLAPVDRRLAEHLRVELERQQERIPDSSARVTLVIPTEEPALAGFTNSGNPSVISSRRTPSGSASKRSRRMV